jgi:hypothetical protein
MGNVMKEKDVFHVSVRANSTDVLLQSVESFLHGYYCVLCTTHDVLQNQGREFYNTGICVSLNSDKSVLKMTKTS